MISTFDIEKLTSLLTDFYTLTQIRITVFDDKFRELAAYPQQRSQFCRLIRSNPTAREKCRQCDRHACQAAAKRKTAYTYICHAGLTECILPISSGGIVTGYLFFGQVMAYRSHEDGFAQISKKCTDYHLDTETLKNACLEQPLRSPAYIRSAANILQAIASYVCLERIVFLSPETMAAQISEYIDTHLAEELNAASLCSQFHIGKTRLYELSAQYYGTGIAEHIRSQRIAMAKKLLTEQPSLSLAEISVRCGFRDYNYFITVFRRIVGVPPKQYVKLHALHLKC